LNERVDEAVELAELRRRAYGPEGGIDARGLTRLRELEDRARAVAQDRRAEPSASATAPSASATAPSRAAAPEPAVGPAAAAPTASPGRDDTPAGSGIARRLATGRRWPWLVAALLIGGFVGGGVSTAVARNGPQPVAVLRVVDDERAPSRFVPDDARAHEAFHALDVRSWTDPRSGYRCLGVVAADGDGEGYFWTACAPAALGTMLDAEVYDAPGDREYPFQSERVDAPEGTYFRLQLDGEVVKVWRVDRAEPTPRA
jgi:hypothetical protein